MTSTLLCRIGKFVEVPLLTKLVVHLVPTNGQATVNDNICNQLQTTVRMVGDQYGIFALQKIVRAEYQFVLRDGFSTPVTGVGFLIIW